ncbi:MAG: PAS domain-containing protein [Candidatus Margulisbacteria bacterium]|nr:PAS domain-containing protein [Candidatus Margulisiibacteriota bacterium]
MFNKIISTTTDSLIKDQQKQIEHLQNIINSQSQTITEQNSQISILGKEIDDLITNTPGYHFHGFRDGSIIIRDKKIVELSGYNMEDFNSKKIKWTDLVIAEDRLTFKQTLINALKNGEPYIREYRIRSKNGETHWIQERGVITQTQNKDFIVDGIFFEITERMLARQKIIANEIKLNFVFNNLSSGILLFDKNTGNFHSNRVYREIFDLEQDMEIADFPCVFWVDRMIHDEFHNILNQNKKIFNFESEIRTAKGEIKSVTCSALQENGWLLMSFTDITNQKIISRQKRLIETHERLKLMTGGLSHDFNNLLAVLMGNLELAMLNLPENNFLAEALIVTDKMSEIVRQLLRISIPKYMTKINEVNLTAVMNDVLDSIASNTKYPDVHINIKSVETNPSVNADSGQIKKIFKTIIENSLDALGKNTTDKKIKSLLINISQVSLNINQIDVLLRTNLEANKMLLADDIKSGNYIKITITDNGSGIETKNIKKIFDPYFSTKERGQQRAMGLNLTETGLLILANKGFICCRSRIGQGTVFDIYFPVVV